jgi:hypothetical protein
VIWATRRTAGHRQHWPAAEGDQTLERAQIEVLVMTAAKSVKKTAVFPYPPG